jgi:hypothetical protein
VRQTIGKQPDDDVAVIALEVSLAVRAPIKQFSAVFAADLFVSANK